MPAAVCMQEEQGQASEGACEERLPFAKRRRRGNHARPHPPAAPVRARCEAARRWFFLHLA